MVIGRPARSLLIAAVLAAGCMNGRTGPGPTPARGPSGKPKEIVLTETPDIYTPPKEGRYTLQLVWYIDQDPEKDQGAARKAAEQMANLLRSADIPAFILVRSLEQHGSQTHRLPVYYVCVGAFDKETSDEAAYVRSVFREKAVTIPGEHQPQQLFKRARFIVLNAALPDDAEDLLSLYEMPERARYGVVVAVYQGPEHRQLARAFALKVRAQGHRPLIQASEQASRVVVGASEFRDDPTLKALARQFQRVEHNILGYISFRGTHKGYDDQKRAAAVRNDLLAKGYDCWAARVRLRPPGSPANFTVTESRVYVVRQEGGRLTLDQLKRAYQEMQPHEVQSVAYLAEPIDLTEGAWRTTVRNPVPTLHPRP